MSKVSVGVRGWRFDEDVIFDDDGQLRPIDEMPEDDRNRLLRLAAILGEPCDACWLIHGEADLDRCNPAAVVYGEPLSEVVLCDDHEADFVYWFRELGGSEHAGTAALQERFHEWFDDGGRAPEDYPGIEHVDEDPESLPSANGREGVDAVEEQVAELDEAERDALDLDIDDLDV